MQTSYEKLLNPITEEKLKNCDKKDYPFIVKIVEEGCNLQVETVDHCNNDRYFPLHSNDKRGWEQMFFHLAQKTWFTKEHMTKLMIMYLDYMEFKKHKTNEPLET